MSLRAISDKLTVQNKLIVDFTDERYQKNSDRVQDSFDGLNDSVSSIASFLKSESDEDRTDESKERLRSKDDEPDAETQSKGLFGGLLNSDNKKSSGGLLGGIFSKALGILVKSLPLIGLASIFFSDVIAGLLTAVFKDPDAGSMVQRLISGALLGMFFGKKGALVLGVLNAILDEDSKEALKDMGKTLRENENVQSLITGFIESLNELVKSVAALVSGDFNVENIVNAFESLAVVLSPFLAYGAAKYVGKKILKKGASLLGSGKDKAVDVLKKGSSTAAATTATKTAVGTASKTTASAATNASSNIPSRTGPKGSTGRRDPTALKERLASGERKTPKLPNTTPPPAATAGKAVGKKAMLGAVAKAVPGLSVLAGVGFGINALMKGDPVAAGLHVASGIAGLVPGIGTATSLTLTGAAVARESGMLGGGGGSDLKVEVGGKSEVLSDATRERDELVAKTSSNVIMDNSTTNNVSNGGGGGVSISSPISFFDSLDPYHNARV